MYSVNSPEIQADNALIRFGLIHNLTPEEKLLLMLSDIEIRKVILDENDKIIDERAREFVKSKIGDPQKMYERFKLYGLVVENTDGKPVANPYVVTLIRQKLRYAG